VGGIDIACDAKSMQTLAIGVYVDGLPGPMDRQKAAVGACFVAAIAHIHGIAFKVVRRVLLGAAVYDARADRVGGIPAHVKL